MRNLVLLAIAGLIVVLAGCGGSGGGNTNPADNGSVKGQLSAANAANYSLVLDGHRLSQKPAADGTFAIPSLPAGDHSLTVVANGGFMGAHVNFVVSDGQVTDIGTVDPVAGGQIAGLVSKKDDGGNLTPLEGVEVLADAEPIYYEGGGTTNSGMPLPVPPVKQGDALQLRAVTDANGSYLMPAVPAGAYAVTVNVPGLVQGASWVYVSAGSTAACDFQLEVAVEPGVGTVSGNITGLQSGGSPIPLEGATVSISTEGDWRPVQPTDPIPLPVTAITKALVPKQAQAMMPPVYDFNQFMTLTDQAGAYSLNVPSGHLSLSVWAEGYESAFESFTLQPRETLSKSYQLTQWTTPPPIEPGQPVAKKK